MEQLAIFQDGIPEASPGTAPTAYADTLGQWFVRRTASLERKVKGQYFTPPDIARFMARMCGMHRQREVTLDVGAGAGMLSCALVEEAAHCPSVGEIRIDAYENDALLAMLLRRSLSYAAHWARGQRLTVEVAVVEADFVLAEADVLAEENLFGRRGPRYTVAIMNPPYFKLPKSDPRARLADAVVHGQPNIYSLCMAIGAHLLIRGGTMVSISPRSFATGDYFRLFREKLFSVALPDAIHLFDSRKDAFRRDEVLQENVIMRLRRDGLDDGAAEHAPMVMVSSSRGRFDLHDASSFEVPLDSVLRLDTSEKMLSIPTSEAEESLREWVASWPETLLSLGLQVSTGPVVAFRARDHIVNLGARRILDMSDSPPVVPLLLLNHVDVMSVTWPLPSLRKAQHIRVTESSRSILLRNKTYVLTRRFTSKEQKRRIVAAPLLGGQLPGEYLGIENHLNYIYRPGGELTPDEAYGVATVLNSRYVDDYFRIFSGHTQVNATELRVIPLPRIEQIAAMGRAARRGETRSADELVESLLSPPSGFAIRRRSL
jgi:adenine-specific DNA-methyltransferase